MIVEKPKIEWEDFLYQHDGIQLMKELYNLTDEEIKSACVKGISKLIQTKQMGVMDED